MGGHLAHLGQRRFEFLASGLPVPNPVQILRAVVANVRQFIGIAQALSIADTPLDTLVIAVELSLLAIIAANVPKGETQCMPIALGFEQRERCLDNLQCLREIAGYTR